MFKLNSIRKKMLFYFILTTVLISVISIYTLQVSNKFLMQMDDMYDLSIRLGEIEENLNTTHDHLTNYLSSKSSDQLNYFNEYSTYLMNNSNNLKANMYEFSEFLILEDIANMINSYLEQANKAVLAKRGRKISEYIAYYEEASNIAQYITFYIDKLNVSEIQKNTNYYLVISQNMNIIRKSNILLIVDSIVLVLSIIIYITYKMTEPISKLSHSANELSKGNFEVEEVIVTSEDEIKIMVEAFNKMKSSIQNYINELHEKSEIKSKLMEEKMKNLKMQHLLNNAELQALQSQINPHFLYNTLNAAVQLSMIEGADQTSLFIENISSLFRYNVRKLDTTVTLEEEIKNVKAYLNLLKVRFGDLIRFDFDIDDNALDLKMPPLILQPIVENAYIHGIGDKEEGGHIRVRVSKCDKHTVIEIEDDGKGMSEEQIKEMYSKVNSPEASVLTKPKKGHTTGIGLSNVIHRLEIYFFNNVTFNVESTEGIGTKISIKVPSENGGDVHV